MTEWYYADRQRRQLGPHPAAHLAQRYRAGEIDAATLVWREGMASWQPLGSLRAQASAAIVQAKALQVQVAEHVAVHGGCPTNGDGDFGEADSYAGSGLSAVEFGEFEDSDRARAVIVSPVEDIILPRHGRTHPDMINMGRNTDVFMS